MEPLESDPPGDSLTDEERFARFKAGCEAFQAGQEAFGQLLNGHRDYAARRFEPSAKRVT